MPALDAALAVADVRCAERIVVTGDICAGPQPVAVFERLLTLGERVVLVRGNADRELVELIDGATPSGSAPIAAWAAAALGRRPDLVAILRALPHPVTLELDGFVLAKLRRRGPHRLRPAGRSVSAPVS